MFSKENQSWLYDEKPKPLPVAQISQSPEPPLAESVRKSRSWLVVVPCLMLGLVGAIAIAGTQMSERPEIVVPVAEAKAAPVAVAVVKPVDESGKVVKPIDKNSVEKSPSPVQILPVAKVEPKPVPVSVPVVREEKPAHDFKLANLPKPEGKPKIGVEEKSDKNAEKKLTIYDELLKANEAGKEADKPILLWANGILDDEKNLKIQEAIGDRAIHVKGEGKDVTGPYVKLLAADDNTWFIRASKFSGKTADRIKEVLPTRNYQNIKFPQAEPPQEARKQNNPSGDCLWCSVDTLASYNGFKTDFVGTKHAGKRNENKNPWFAWKMLNMSNIPAQWTKPGFSDWTYLKKACDEGIGATVGINMDHEINLAGITKEYAAIIDNNDPQLKTRIVPLEKFLNVWDGTSVVIFPKGKEHVLRSWGQRGPNGFPVRQSGELDGDAQIVPGQGGQETGKFVWESKGKSSKVISFWMAAGYSRDEAEEKCGDCIGGR